MGQTVAKAQNNPKAFPLNDSLTLPFPVVTLSSTTQNNSVIAARLWLPTCVKIYRVVAGMSGSLAGTCSLNVVAGIAAEVSTQYASLPIPETDYAGQPISPNTQAYPPAYATSGQKLFLADQALTVAENPATVLTPSDSAATGAYAPNTPGMAYDALWGPGGAELTLRLPCTGFTGNVAVTLFCKSYDPPGNQPTGNQSGAAFPVLTSFNPAVDLP